MIQIFRRFATTRCSARQIGFRTSSTKTHDVTRCSSHVRETLKTLRTLLRTTTRGVNGSILGLPAEVLLHIAAFLPLCDIASLAIAAKAFVHALGYSWDLLSLPHNKGQRLLFLRQFDVLNPCWLLCRVCLKYHCWNDSKLIEPRQWAHNCQPMPIIRLNDEVTLHQAHWQLVKRARHYKDSRFGKSIESLCTIASSDGWACKTEAMFDKDDYLLIRVISTIQIEHMLAYPGALMRDRVLSGVMLCNCHNPRTRNKVLDHCKATLDELIIPRRLSLETEPPQMSTYIPKSTKRPDIRCMSCGLVYEIGWHLPDPANIGCMKVVRYYSVGKASVSTAIPLVWTYDVENVCNKKDNGLLNPSEIFIRKKMRLARSKDYSVFTEYTLDRCETSFSCPFTTRNKAQAVFKCAKNAVRNEKRIAECAYFDISI